jgi:hypothetical protein
MTKARKVMLHVALTTREMADLIEFQKKFGLPNRTAAVRELLRRAYIAIKTRTVTEAGQQQQSQPKARGK